MKKILSAYFAMLLLIVLGASLWSENLTDRYQQKSISGESEAVILREEPEKDPEENPAELTKEIPDDSQREPQEETQPEIREETQPDTQEEIQEETQEETEEESRPETREVPRDEIFLTVSEIRLSVVGDSEDIYSGSVPREQVTWKSRDPEIIEVQNGMIQAVGVGETEITAVWKDQHLSCRASCLAENQEQLTTLGFDVLEQPKRIPPATDDSCTRYFAGGAMVGDSITYALLHWEREYGALGNPQFIARGGVSVFGLLGRERLYYFRGGDCLLEDVVSASDLNSVFVLLGQNDLGFRTPKEVISNLKTLMGRVRRKNPKVEIYLQSCLPVRQESPHYSGNNGILRDFNKLLKPFADSRNYHYVDIAPYMENHLGSLPSGYSMDEIHPNEAGCKAWMAALRACLYMEELAGNS